jgi:hypothetical protein
MRRILRNLINILGLLKTLQVKLVQDLNPFYRYLVLRRITVKLCLYYSGNSTDSSHANFMIFLRGLKTVNCPYPAWIYLVKTGNQ